MRETQYWVRICEGERCLGAGFLITRAFVLTALHCLRWRSAGNSRFDLELPDGRRLAGQLCEEIKDADLALIAVEDAESHGLAPAAPTDWPRPEVGWRGTYCPPSEETRLSGRVTHETVDYRNAADGVFKAVQLTVDQQLGTYDGYSGSPVDTAGAQARHEQHGQTAPRPVVGILMEERLDRADASRVSNVLIAASVLHAMDRFTQFSIGHLRNQVSVPESHRPAPPAAQAQQGDEEHTTPSLTSTDLYLRQLQRWEEEGVLSQEEATEERRWALRLLRRRLAQGPVDG
ncbi:S1 family peptidase [Streptomyces chartreusis]|uniref:S1 family peptidase n=1 Tax=Streptomyces chartreusis TaxID=1969 RepID=UPI00382733C9